MHQRHLLSLPLYCLPAARPAHRWRTRRCRCGSGSSASRVRWMGLLLCAVLVPCCASQDWSGLLVVAHCALAGAHGLKPDQQLETPLLTCRPERLCHLLQPRRAAQQQGRRSAVSGRRAAVRSRPGRAAPELLRWVPTCSSPAMPACKLEGQPLFPSLFPQGLPNSVMGEALPAAGTFRSPPDPKSVHVCHAVVPAGATPLPSRRNPTCCTWACSATTASSCGSTAACRPRRCRWIRLGWLVWLLFVLLPAACALQARVALAANIQSSLRQVSTAQALTLCVTLPPLIGR